MKRPQSKREQPAADVQVCIGALLDAWDWLPNDVSQEPELETVRACMARLFAVVEGAAPDVQGADKLAGNSDVQAQDAGREVFDATRQLCRDIIVEVGPEDDGTRDEMLTRLDEMQELWPLAEAVAMQAQIDALQAEVDRWRNTAANQMIQEAVARERERIVELVELKRAKFNIGTRASLALNDVLDQIRARSAKGVLVSER